jgi:uncharacterized protein (DUF305 family)
MIKPVKGSKNMTPKGISILAVAGAILLPVSAQAAKNVDQVFADNIAKTELAQEKMAQVGSERAQDTKLKEYSTKLASDAKEDQQKLKEVAKKAGVEPVSYLQRTDSRTVKDLQTEAKGKTFDQKLAKELRSEQEDALDTYVKEAKNGKSPELRDWARAQVTETLDELAQAQKLEASLGSQR